MGERSKKIQDTDAVRVWLVLWKASRAVEQNAQKSIARMELGLSDFAVLEMLLHRGPQPVNVIGRKVMLTSGSITTAVDRLEKRKLVQRKAHPEDQRARLVQLTPEGERLIGEAFRQHTVDMEETMSDLTKGDRKRLIRLLKKLGLSAAEKLSRT